jgi:hypothetical protein
MLGRFFCYLLSDCVTLGRFLGSFATFQKFNVNFFMSVRPSFHMEQPCCRWVDFCEILCCRGGKGTVEGEGVDI